MNWVCTSPLYNSLAWQLLGNGNDHSNKDNKGEELLFLKELKDFFSIFIYNYIKLTIEDINKVDCLAKGINIAIIP